MAHTMTPSELRTRAAFPISHSFGPLVVCALSHSFLPITSAAHFLMRTSPKQLVQPHSCVMYQRSSAEAGKATHLPLVMSLCLDCQASQTCCLASKARLTSC